ncbi:MAG: potassium transporter KtrB [Lachnospiraceae bacterium]|nr:potassium transporter KtrB [Lachnospiraceae bacterium]
MKISHKNRKQKNRKTTTQLIAIGFLIAIIIGTVILMLPVSSATGKWTNPVDAMFTATTSVCVTGLTVYDTFSYWSTFGHIVMLCLIQCGGLGIVAFTTILTVILGRRVTLKDRLLLEDAFNLTTLSGLVRFLKKIFIGTFIVEGVGALIYMFVFVPEYGAKGIWISVFTAVSAFCNAGIDIIGDSSLVPYSSNIIINMVTMVLIVSGGIGFIVWWDFLDTIGKVRHKDIKFKHFWSKLKLHTKIVIITTLVLIITGAAFVLLLEYNNAETLGAKSWPEKILAAVFQSVTVRTAGFTMISQKGLRDCTAFICIILMFIGGSSVGTAGGVKTGTVAVIILAAISVIKGSNDTVVFGRKIPAKTVRKALAVFTVSIAVTFLAIIALIMVSEINFIDATYEIVSAVATVGLTRDTTGLLNMPGKLIIILCMYLGRIGPISMAIAFAKRGSNENRFSYPDEEITVG